VGSPDLTRRVPHGKRETIYYWSTWAGKESRINEPFPGEEATVFPMIGFQGEGSFKIRVPDVAPGEYRITKGFSSGPKGRETRSEIEIRVGPLAPLTPERGLDRGSHTRLLDRSRVSA
jgi:hypothetical protein